LHRDLLAEIFESSIATRNSARRTARNTTIDKAEYLGLSGRSTLVLKRPSEAIQDREDTRSESKKSKVSVAEGISQLANEIKESRKARIEIANKPDRAI
jgi:hypothetical protein